MERRFTTRMSCTLSWCETYLVNEEELPYWHLKHEVVLAKAETDIRNSTVEEAGGSEHQDQVEVPWKGSLDEGKDSHCYANDAYRGLSIKHKQKI